MYSRFLYYILQFRGVMILTMASLLVATIVLMVLMRDFRWTSKRRLMVITLFFQMPVRYMVYLAANYIQFMFVIDMIGTLQDVQLSHLIFLIILGVIQAVSIAQPVESIRSFIGSVMLYVAFLIVDLLKSYIFELQFDWRIAFVCILLCAFLVLYSIYFFINSVKCLASRNVEPKRILLRRPVRHHASPAEDAGVIDLDVVDLDTLDLNQEEDITEDTGVINEEDED